MTQFIRIRVDDNGTLAGLQRVKRVIVKENNREIRELVKRVTLPTAKNVAPRKSGALASKMHAGAAGQRAFIENKSPYAGLIEFGGTRTDVIHPKNKHALLTPAGPRAKVSGPRKYTGQHKMAKAIELTQDEILNETCDALARAIATATGGSLTG